MLRTNIHTKERGVICVNTYILNLMPSGFGKGHSTNIFEENLLCGFKRKFTSEIFPAKAELNLIKIAHERALRDKLEEEDSIEKVRKEFYSLGVLPFSFDAATGPALKQLRQLLLLASSGSMNIEIDEIAQNLLGNTEALNVLFELYDKGLVKPKLIKNTKENTRSEEVEGYTPTNLMMFGTPIRLLDGGKLEGELNEMLVSGYARRLLFGYSAEETKRESLTATEIYDSLTDSSVSDEEKLLRNYFTNLASTANYGKQLNMDKSVSVELIQYQLDCEKKARKISDFDEMAKAEMNHRYFKVLKVVGAYSFIDMQRSITSKNLGHAIEIVEDSGTNFKRIQQRDAVYIRLAKYLAYTKKSVTNVDLIEELQFYKGNEAHRKNLMTLAIAYGYMNNIIIKRSFVDDIEFFIGESLEENKLDKIIVSHSAEITTGYQNDIAPFKNIHLLTQLPVRNFINHHLSGDHRHGANIVGGCNLCILDIDGEVQLHTVQKLLEKFTYMTYTTKRHTAKKNRFRILMPLSHTVKLNEVDYKQFMKNIYNWLPFDMDTATCDRPRKWLSHDGQYHYNNGGKLLDVTMFIPRTDKAIKQEERVVLLSNMSNVERWFAVRMSQGNRNNLLLRFGLTMLDAGITPLDIQAKLFAFNKKLDSPIEEGEIQNTVMSTIHQRAGQKSANK